MLLDYIKKYEKSYIITSILMIIFSIFLVVMPEAVLNTVIIILGIVGLIGGIFHVISFLRADGEIKIFSNELFQGLMEIIFSILVFRFKATVISIIPIIVGIWIIVASILKLQLAFKAKELINNNWIVLLITSIISIVFGVLVIANPFETVITLTVISGIFLLITEIANLAESIFVLSKLKNIQ